MAGVSGSMRTVFIFGSKAYNLTKAQFSGALKALALNQVATLDPVKEEWKELGTPVFADKVGAAEALEHLTRLASGSAGTSEEEPEETASTPAKRGRKPRNASTNPEQATN